MTADLERALEEAIIEYGTARAEAVYLSPGRRGRDMQGAFDAVLLLAHRWAAARALEELDAFTVFCTTRVEGRPCVHHGGQREWKKGQREALEREVEGA